MYKISAATLSIVAVMLLASANAASTGQATTIHVSQPSAGSKVLPGPVTISGDVSDPNAAIFVIIHPKKGGFWIQPPVLNNNGAWSVDNANFGDPGALHSGLEFQVRAFVAKGTPPQQGQVPGWPSPKDVEAQSNVIDVTRQ